MEELVAKLPKYLDLSTGRVWLTIGAWNEGYQAFYGINYPIPELNAFGESLIEALASLYELYELMLSLKEVFPIV